MLPIELDWMTIGVFFFSFAICAGIVVLVSVFGAREQSFEEALEEQKRKNTKQKQQKSQVQQEKKQQKKQKQQQQKQQQQLQQATTLHSGLDASLGEEGETGNGADDPQHDRGKKKRRKKYDESQEPGPQPGRPSKPGPSLAIPKVLEVHRQYLQDDLAEDEAVIVPQPPTPDPSPIQDQLIPEKIPEEPTPKSTPRATPEPPVANAQANNKKGKKKMKIEEVTEPMVEEKVVELREEPAQPSPKVATETKKGGKKKGGKPEPTPEVNSKAPAQQPNNAKLGPKELMNMVKKTTFDETEAQQMIEVLLNKQAGTSSGGGDWVDTGNKGQNEIKQLQKQLADKSMALDEEVAKNKSITDRMNLLRQELNQAKSVAVSAQRKLEESERSHQMDMANLNQAIQQEKESRARENVQWQASAQAQGQHAEALQATIHELQTSLNAVSAQAQQPQFDPALDAELKSLRNAKGQLEMQIKELKDELSKSKAQSDKLSKASQDVAKAQGENKKLEDKLKASESKLQESDKLMKDMKKSKQDMESNINSLSAKVKQLDQERSQLSEENERLADQLAATANRPDAEGQESGHHQNGVENGDRVESKKLQEQLDEEGAVLKKKMQIIVQEKEDLIKEQNVIVAKFEAEIDSYKNQVQQIQASLDAQKAKNEDLRNKNWKAMEALNNTEQSYQKLLKQNQSTAGANKSDMEKSEKALLQRIFPDVSSKKDSKDHLLWLEDFAGQLKAKVEAADVSKVQSDSTDSLQAQVDQYKAVLADTEKMLHELQSNVESEEKVWKDRLSSKDNELNKVKTDLDELSKKNQALNESLKVVKQAEEMQEKLQELQSKLSEEETEKNEILRKFGAAEKELKEKETLQKEITNLRAELNKKDDQLAKLNQVVTTSQDALQKEQKTVELLSNNAPAAEQVTSENGSKNAAASVEMSPASKAGSVASVASAVSAESTDSAKKKKKKATVAQ